LTPAAAFSSAELSPTLFLERADAAFGARPAVVDGNLTLTYAGLADRARRAAGALRAIGVRDGDRVALLCSNSHVMLELHNGVPLAGAVMVPLNTRLAVDELVYMVEHCDARVLAATEELAEPARAIGRRTDARVIVDAPGGEYEQLLASAEPYAGRCTDERSLLAVSYTSGSTGRPKGVMYSHRGAYLQGVAMAHHSRFDFDSVYLWTLAMFHCNGWACTWAVTAGGGVHLCQRRIVPEETWAAICTRGVTHLSAAPTVLTMLAEAAASSPLRPPRPVAVATGGAPPTPALLERLAALQMTVTHFYGLTETYGPSVVNAWQPEWSSASQRDQARLNARQGIGNVVTAGLRVVRSDGSDVPADGESLGEIVVRGNTVMLGYYEDDEATAASTLDGGWFRTGDLGVRHADGYVELRDRAKDIIISGGENIASVEVERVLAEHPAVLEAAVVARPDEKWGEVPVAFVTIRAGVDADANELIEFVRVRIAHFKAPKAVYFRELPKTSTGKVEKHVLRALLETL
jgi:fatty-acyl-CoA synthase